MWKFLCKSSLSSPWPLSALAREEGTGEIKLSGWQLGAKLLRALNAKWIQWGPLKALVKEASYEKDVYW